MSPENDRAAAVKFCIHRIYSLRVGAAPVDGLQRGGQTRANTGQQDRGTATPRHSPHPKAKKKQRSQLPLRLQDHKSEWKRLERCRLCVSPGARNGHMPGRSIFLLQLQEMFNIVRVWLEIHSWDRMCVLRYIVE